MSFLCRMQWFFVCEMKPQAQGQGNGGHNGRQLVYEGTQQTIYQSTIMLDIIETPLAILLAYPPCLSTDSNGCLEFQ